MLANQDIDDIVVQERSTGFDPADLRNTTAI